MSISYILYLFLRNAKGVFITGFFLPVTYSEPKNLYADFTKQSDFVNRGIFIVGLLLMAILHCLLCPITIPLIATIKTVIDLKTSTFSSKETYAQVSEKLASMSETQTNALAQKILNYSPWSNSSTNLVTELNKSTDAENRKQAILSYFNKEKNNGKYTFQIIIENSSSPSHSPVI